MCRTSYINVLFSQPVILSQFRAHIRITHWLSTYSRSVRWRHPSATYHISITKVSQHRSRRTYFAQYCRQMRVLSCSLKVILALHIYEHISLNAKSSFNAQSIIGGYGTLTIKNLIEYGVRTAYYQGKLTLRYSTCLKLILYYFAWMYWRRRHQIAYIISLYIFHTIYLLLVMITTMFIW